VIAGSALAGSKSGERISFRQPCSSGHGWLVLPGDLSVLRLLAGLLVVQAIVTLSVCPPEGRDSAPKKAPAPKSEGLVSRCFYSALSDVTKSASKNCAHPHASRFSSLFRFEVVVTFFKNVFDALSKTPLSRRVHCSNNRFGFPSNVVCIFCSPEHNA
jgi:hypothetical protein